VIADSVFLILAGVTVFSAAATVVSRSPVHAAIWFGLMLLGTSGLFLYQGAQFLAVATIVVYAGAILVTFLFVLMLAQPRGRTTYDRISWEAFISSLLGAAIVGVMSLAVGSVLMRPEAADAGCQVTAAERQANILRPEHVARLGSELFGPQLIAVQVAGVLLLAALVGTAVIVAHARQSSAARGRADAATHSSNGRSIGHG
jgi:NADH-quinone oxidoreductase subunit J